MLNFKLEQWIFQSMALVTLYHYYEIHTLNVIDGRKEFKKNTQFGQTKMEELYSKKRCLKPLYLCDTFNRIVYASLGSLSRPLEEEVMD